MSNYFGWLEFKNFSWMSLFFAILLGLSPAIFAATVEEYEERIQFAPGTSSGTFSQELKPEGYYRYLLRAKAFQEMTVSIRSEGGKAYFHVWGLGPELGVLTRGKVYGKWSAGLPKTGDYKIGVHAEMDKTRFTLEVTIVDKEVRREPRPTRKEAEKVCGFVAASHSGTVKGKSCAEGDVAQNLQNLYHTPRLFRQRN